MPSPGCRCRGHGNHGYVACVQQCITARHKLINWFGERRQKNKGQCRSLPHVQGASGPLPEFPRCLEPGSGSWKDLCNRGVPTTPISIHHQPSSAACRLWPVAATRILLLGPFSESLSHSPRPNETEIVSWTRLIDLLRLRRKRGSRTSFNSTFGTILQLLISANCRISCIAIVQFESHPRCCRAPMFLHQWNRHQPC
jgi:hypothetical protein